MTNLQNGAPAVRPAQLRRLWLGLPIGAAGAVAVILSAAVLVPLWLSVRRDAERLANLQQARDQVSLLRRQLDTLVSRQEKVAAQQARLFDLVSGSGDISTFLTALDQEARRAGVQMELYEPQAAPPPSEAEEGQGRQGRGQGSAGGDRPARGGRTARRDGENGEAEGAAARQGQLDVDGLARRSFLVAARGSFPDLLRFLRRLEERNVLVVQSDLQVALEEDGRNSGDRPPNPAGPVLLKVTMSLYEKVEKPAEAPPSRGNS